MFTIPNFLSLLRIPLAMAFFQHNPLYRAIAIILALASDGLDGYLARRYNQSSKLGTLLDPLMDKFFVFFALGVLLEERRLEMWQAATMLCRDFSVILFGFYLAIRGKLASYQFSAIWCGKVTTVMQLLVLFGLTFTIPFPSIVFLSFAVLGLLALVELYSQKNARLQQENES